MVLHTHISVHASGVLSDQVRQQHCVSHVGELLVDWSINSTSGSLRPDCHVVCVWVCSNIPAFQHSLADITRWGWGMWALELVAVSAALTSIGG